MRYAFPLVRSLGRSCCVLLPLAGNANSQELPSTVKDLLDIRNFAKARSAGNVTPAQARKAADAIDAVGTDASLGVAAAASRFTSNPVAGLPSAVLGSALMPIVKSEGERARQLTSVQLELHKAVLSGDRARISELQKRQVALTAEASTWRPNYGSFPETVSRVAQGVTYHGDNRAVSSLWEIAKRVLDDTATAAQGMLLPAAPVSSLYRLYEGGSLVERDPTCRYRLSESDETAVRQTLVVLMEKSDRYANLDYQKRGPTSIRQHSNNGFKAGFRMQLFGYRNGGPYLSEQWDVDVSIAVVDKIYFNIVDPKYAEDGPETIVLERCQVQNTAQ